jgi:hypothetical protein
MTEEGTHTITVFGLHDQFVKLRLVLPLGSWLIPILWFYRLLVVSRRGASQGLMGSSWREPSSAKFEGLSVGTTQEKDKVLGTWGTEYAHHPRGSKQLGCKGSHGWIKAVGL